MKRHFLLLLLLTVLVPVAYSTSKYSQYLKPEWLSHLNATQKGMVLEEFENYGREMDKLNLTEEQEMNKVHEMISKVRDGFWIYRLSSMNEALADSVKTFNKTTGLKVYVYSYVEDAGFLNNIFKRLSEAKYISLVPEGYIIYKLTFKRTREAQGEEFIMAYAPSLTVETDQYDKINKKLTELNTLGLNEFTEGITNLNSGQIFDKRESCTRSLTSILAQMKNITYNTSESAYLSLDLLKVEMEPIKEKITFITPAGTGITLPSGSKIVDGNYRGDVLSPEGVLFGFILPSGKLYMARIENFPVLSGYYQYEEKTGKFGQCYTDSEPVTSGRKKIWHIRREEDETTRQCSLNVSEGIYNFTAEYSFKLDGTRSSKIISTWDITANYSETSGGKKFQIPCINKTASTQAQSLTKKALPQALDDYAYSLHQHLKKKGTDCAIWLGECGENDQLQVITRDQSTHSTLTNAQARRMVETGNFNSGIAIYGCYDPVTGKWKIISNFKKGSLKPNAKFKGQLSEEKADQISDEYVEKIVKERTGKGGEAGGLQRTTRGEAERLPDGDQFKHDHLSLFEAVLAVKSFTRSIVEQARVPEEFWNNSPGNLEKYINSPVHVPAVLCGGGDQTLEELTGAVQLLHFGLDLATDPQKARAMYRSLANMKWEDVKSAAEKTLVSASGYENYSAGGCKARYQGGRHGVTIAMTVFAITKMAKVKDVLDKADEGVREGVKATGKTLAKRLEAFPELAKKVKNLPDGGKAFLDDFAGASDDLIKKFGEHPEWVDGWKVLGEFPNLRKIPYNLEVLNKVKGKFSYNGKAGQEALEEIFTGHKSAQKFIDNLNKAEEFFDGIGIKQWSGIKSAGEVRLVNDAGVVIGKVDNGLFTVTAAKGGRPAPNTYLTQKYIDDHLSRFNAEGGAFIAVKSWVEGGGYKAFPLKKYVMLKSDLQAAIAKYKSSGKISDLEDAIGYSRGDLKGLEHELYVFYLDKSKFKFEMPDGNELGANSFWTPGGKTSGGYREAVLIDKFNSSNQIVHNSNIKDLQNTFSWDKIND